MNSSRRNFIKIRAKGLLGGIIAYHVPSLLLDSTKTGQFAESATPGKYDWEKHYWGFVADTEKCIGCGRCVVACKLENDVPWEPEYNPFSEL